MTRLIIALASFAACGCTMVVYPGPRLPPEQVAYVSRSYYSFGKALCVDDIDGKENERGILDTRFEVLPGPHEVHASVADRSIIIPLPVLFPPQRYDYYGPVTLVFSAAAGRTYHLGMSKLDDGSWEVWLEDTGEHTMIGKATTPRDFYMRSWGGLCMQRKEVGNSN